MKKIIFVAMIFAIAAVSCDNTKSNQTDSYRTEEVVLLTTETAIDTAALISMRINEMKSDSLKLFSTNFANITLNNEMSEAIDYLKGRDIWDWIVGGDQEIFKGNKTAERLSKTIIRKANSTLNSILPSYRKSFAKNLASGLWERDIYVASTGEGNTILNITGGIFAANANIKEFHEILHEDVKHYGFKQVRYRWYKGASEYTYYDIK